MEVKEMDTTYDKYVSSERLGNLERRFRSVSGMFKTALANMLTKADSFPFIEDEDEAMLTIVSMNCIKLLEGICHELD